MTFMSDALDKMRTGLTADAAAETIATAKAQKSALLKGLDAAHVKARGFVDPDLTPEGLERKRAELDAAAKAEFAPRFEQLRARVASAAETLTTQVSAQLPKFGDDAAAIARSQRAWDKARMRLDKGMSLRAVLANASIEEALAIREWGPAYTEAQQYKAPSIGEALNPGPAPDHGQLMRSVDTRLAELAGPDVVKALTAAHDAAGVAAFVAADADYLGAVIAGRPTSQSAIGAALSAHYAEANARAGLPAEYETSDNSPADAPAATVATEDGAA